MSPAHPQDLKAPQLLILSEKSHFRTTTDGPMWYPTFMDDRCPRLVGSLLRLTWLKNVSDMLRCEPLLDFGGTWLWLGGFQHLLGASMDN